MTNTNILIIILPNQLFDFKIYNNIDKNIIDNKDNKENIKKHYIMIEDEYFFTYFKYHKLKLAFHRASMKYYFDKLKEKNKLYIENIEKNHKKIIEDYISDNNIQQIIMFNPIEKYLIDYYNKNYKKNNILFIPSPYFLNNDNLLIKKEINNTYRHDIFYKNQRIKYNIMIDKNNKPIGNKWSFDTENREKFEKNQKELSIKTFNNPKYINEAINYINKHFNNHYGNLNKEFFIYAINRNNAIKLLKDFVKRKLDNFGKYEDALSSTIKFGFHSVLSPYTNIGLITPEDIIKEVKDYKKNIASKEGFIRQVIGWREYCYFIYETMDLKPFYQKHNKKDIPEKFWNAKTNIPFIDNILTNINNYAYSHHIERLMCIGNFLILIGVKPTEIYNWFQTMYIDAYDVFMIPNVYGMLMYGYDNNDNNKKIHMMTKPYFCSSNYILKMSDFKKEEININNKNIFWNDIFDALYYNLINNYQDEFKKIYSTSSSVSRWKKYTLKEKNQYLDLADEYIKWLYKN